MKTFLTSLITLFTSVVSSVLVKIQRNYYKEIEDAKRIATKGRVLKLPPPQKRQHRITITVITYK